MLPATRGSPSTPAVCMFKLGHYARHCPTTASHRPERPQQTRTSLSLEGNHGSWERTNINAYQRNKLRYTMVHQRDDAIMPLIPYNAKIPLVVVGPTAKINKLARDKPLKQVTGAPRVVQSRKVDHERSEPELAGIGRETSFERGEAVSLVDFAARAAACYILWSPDEPKTLQGCFEAISLEPIYADQIINARKHLQDVGEHLADGEELRKQYCDAASNFVSMPHKFWMSILGSKLESRRILYWPGVTEWSQYPSHQ